MKMNPDYQLVYQGESDGGEVAKRNLRDYVLILKELPSDMQEAVHKINQDNMFFSLLGSYNYMNYVGIMRKVNAYLAEHQAELQKQTDLRERIHKSLVHDHQQTSKIPSGVDFDSFYDKVYGLVKEGHPQSAIYELISRYTLDQVDDRFKKLGIVRDDHLSYYYDDELVDTRHAPKFFDIEEVMYQSEFGRFHVLPDHTPIRSAKKNYQKEWLAMWVQGRQQEVIDSLTDYYGDALNDTLEGFNYLNRDRLAGEIKAQLQKQIEDLNIDELSDSPVLELFHKLRQVAKDKTALWDCDNAYIVNAKPLSEDDLFDLMQELDDRKEV